MGIVNRIRTPRGPYSVIYPDCPWRYRDKAAAGRRGVDFKYATMGDQEILDLGPLVRRVTLPDAWLFLWATGPRMELAFEVVKAWGFEFKTIAFTWRKRTAKGKLCWGMGNHTRANEEYVLLGTRGSPRRASKRVHSSVTAVPREHSAKPHQVRRRIQELAGPSCRKLELFARRPVERFPGWDYTGLEYDGRDVGDFLAALASGREMPRVRGGVVRRRR